MNQTITKIAKGIIFGFFTIATISQIINSLQGINQKIRLEPYGLMGELAGHLLLLLIIWYLLYKCKYKWIKGLFNIGGNKNEICDEGKVKNSL